MSNLVRTLTSVRFAALVSEDRRRLSPTGESSPGEAGSDPPPTRHVWDPQRIGECLVLGLIPMNLVRLSMAGVVTLGALKRHPC